MKAIIVTGSREWEDEQSLHAAIDAEKPDVIIHGDNPRGADAMVVMCILQRRGRHIVSVVPMPAQWDKHGRAAGPKRNSAMLEVLLTLREHGYEVAVVAAPLPQGSGTQDMMAKARATDTRVRIVEPGPDESCKVDCPHCKGQGRVMVGEPGHAPMIMGCWECDGKGKVKAP
jgi:hypothetical protein